MCAYFQHLDDWIVLPDSYDKFMFYIWLPLIAQLVYQNYPRMLSAQSPYNAWMSDDTLWHIVDPDPSVVLQNIILRLQQQ